MALAIDSASSRPMNAMASAPGANWPTSLSCTDGMCGSGRLCGIFAVRVTAVLPV